MDDAPINVFDYARLAERALARPAYEYYASGAHDEVTLRRNRAAFEEIAMHYRVLADSGQPDLSTTFLGASVNVPFAIAPTAFQRMATPDGELATTRAADSVGCLMTLSTLSNTSLEDVAAASTGPRWFQLYVYKDRAATKELVNRASAAGFGAIVLTVDAPYLGVRERDVRNGFSLPPGLTVANLTASQMENLPDVEHESGLAAYFADLLEPALSWETLEWLVGISTLPVIVKGVVRGDDARRAAGAGASAVWVSNHGGRQLDTSPATIEVLPRVVHAVDGQVEVFVDGGVRRGTDVVKALSYGARGVFMGRPILWGLAHAGEQGARHVLEIIREEVRLAMSLAGASRVEELGPWLVSGQAR